MKENDTCWVLVYGYSKTETNSGHVAKFDNFKEADEYATEANERSELIYSITYCMRTVAEYCKAYGIDYTKFK